MTTLKKKFGKCERCNKQVRIDTEAAIKGTPGHGLWECDGKLYGYHCYKIVIGDYPPKNSQVKYYNPDWDNEPLPY